MKIEEYEKSELIDIYNRHSILGLEDEVWIDGYRFKVIESDKLMLCFLNQSRINDFIKSNYLYIPEIFEYLDESMNNVFRYGFLSDKPGFIVVGDGLLSIPDEIFERTYIKSGHFANCKAIGNSSFYDTGYLEDVYCPKIEFINESAFAYSSLKNINITNVEMVGSNSFFKVNDCNFDGELYNNLINLDSFAFSSSSIKVMIAPKLLRVENSSFLDSLIEKFVGKEVYKVCDFAFKNSSLKFIELPDVKYLAYESFMNTKLQKFESNNDLILDIGVFRDNRYLKELILPNVTHIDNSVLKRSSVDVIDLRSVTEIKEIDHYSYMFSGFKEIHLETMKEFYHYYFDIKADEKIYLNKFCIVDNYERAKYRNNLVFVE